MVARDGIEPPTPAFSGLRSTIAIVLILLSQPSPNAFLRGHLLLTICYRLVHSRPGLVVEELLEAIHCLDLSLVFDLCVVPQGRSLVLVTEQMLRVLDVR